MIYFICAVLIAISCYFLGKKTERFQMIGLLKTASMGKLVLTIEGYSFQVKEVEIKKEEGGKCE